MKTFLNKISYIGRVGWCMKRYLLRCFIYQGCTKKLYNISDNPVNIMPGTITSCTVGLKMTDFASGMRLYTLSKNIKPAEIPNVKPSSHARKKELVLVPR